jgi:type IV secretory pathway TrbL component
MNINIIITLLESVIKMLVSSAKRTILLYLGIIVGKSFIYSRKRSGPRTEPWGKIFLINSQSEELLLLLLLILLSITF